jgi:acetolactate synthase-1/2/3 large subunit
MSIRKEDTRPAPSVRPPLADPERRFQAVETIAPAENDPPAGCRRGPRRSFKKTTPWRGSEILTEALFREGVETFFGYPGGVVLPFYDTIYDVPLKHVLVRHEQGGGHMAEGYARATGRVGVAMGTSGPGATNLVTAITDAWMDSVPVVFLTGQVSTNLIGADAFQEADITGITRPITKHNYLVKNVDDLPRVIQEAFHIAGTGRPGPVVVDLPKDMLLAMRDEVAWPDAPRLRGYNPKVEGHPGQLKKAADLINGAKAPLLYVGGGALHARAWDLLVELSEKAKVPVNVTSMGIGAFPADHPNYISMLGMHGSFASNMAVTHCDLLIAVGSRFDDRVTGKLDRFARNAKKIHIDIDPTSVSKNVKVDVPIIGDARLVLRDLLPRVNAVASRPEWFARIDAWRNEHPLTYVMNEREIMPQYALETLAQATRGNCVYTTDVGQHQMWACQWVPASGPYRFISSCGLGTMGFGFPAAIGAAFGSRDLGENLPAVCITSEGSLQMNIQEMSVAVEHRLPVKVFNLNNDCLGMIRQWQELFYKERYSFADLPCQPDWVKLAEAYGAQGARVTEPGQLTEAVRWMIETPGPVILDVAVVREENVYPMVPAGGAVDEMVLDPKEAQAAAQRLGLDAVQAD